LLIYNRKAECNPLGFFTSGRPYWRDGYCFAGADRGILDASTTKEFTCDSRKFFSMPPKTS